MALQTGDFRTFFRELTQMHNLGAEILKPLLPAQRTAALEKICRAYQVTLTLTLTPTLALTLTLTLTLALNPTLTLTLTLTRCGAGWRRSRKTRTAGRSIG